METSISSGKLSNETQDMLDWLREQGQVPPREEDFYNPFGIPEEFQGEI